MTSQLRRVRGARSVGDRLLLYKPKFRPLHEAVSTIACRLVTAEPQKYSNADAATGDARKELLKALLDGSVYAEGVSWHVPGYEYEPPSVEYDTWDPIDRGVWSHGQFENPDQIYRLDNIKVDWAGDSMEYLDSEGQLAECGKCKIQLSSDDIDRAFCVPETPIRDQRPRPIESHVLPAKSDRRARGKRPAEVRDAVYEWLDRQPDGVRLCNRPYTETAHCYCTDAKKLRDELAINKCLDSIRKVVKCWCQEHQHHKW